MEENKGLIHLYHGKGKGKTTCAMGLALRFSHYEKNVLIVQFLKSGGSGEVKQLEKLDNVTVIAGSVTNTFSWNMTDEEKAETKELHNSFLQKALETPWDLLVLDELCGAITTDMIDEDLIKKLLASKKEDGEIVITGRNPPQYILDAANYITEMVAQRHPFEDNGTPARKGIEY